MFADDGWLQPHAAPGAMQMCGATLQLKQRDGLEEATAPLDFDAFLCLCDKALPDRRSTIQKGLAKMWSHPNSPAAAKGGGGGGDDHDDGGPAAARSDVPVPPPLISSPGQAMLSVGDDVHAASEFQGRDASPASPPQLMKATRVAATPELARALGNTAVSSSGSPTASYTRGLGTGREIRDGVK